MAYETKKTEGGTGGRRGHSNMCHYAGTAVIKRDTKKVRRQISRNLCRIVED